MRWARFALRHPVPTIVFFLVALVVGGFSFTRLAVDLYPAMEFPIAVVVTEYQGAGPQEVESLVTRPLEEVLGTVSGVKSIRSQNSSGSSVVIAEFNWGTDMDFATLGMREKIDRIKSLLPEDAGDPLVFKIDPGALPVLILGLTGGDDLANLKRVAEDEIKPQLERLDGVAQVLVAGGLTREIQVIVDPSRLHSAGLTLQGVVQSLRTENLNLPGGEVQAGRLNLVVRSLGEFHTLDDIAELRLAAAGGRTVRLGDVADVRDTFADIRSKGWIGGEPAVTLTVQKRSGANTVQVADRIKAALGDITAALPGNIQSHVLSDQSLFVRRSVEGVSQSAIKGGLLAILVLYLFLRNFRATLAVGLAIPISVVTTFGALYFGGVTMNIMSMGGLALGIGMLVDNAIVVLENIFRHRREGLPSLEAAATGTGEVAQAVSAATLTTVAVFLPIVFIQGLSKEFFQELALTVSFSLLTSLAVSLTLVPLMAAALLRGAERPEGPILRAIGRIWERLAAGYGRLLTGALRRRWVTVAVAVATLAAAVGLVSRVGTEFVPQMDTSQFRVSIELPDGTRLEETEQAARDVSDLLASLPEIETVYALLGGGDPLSGGGGGGGQTHRANVYGLLVRPTERERSLQTVIEDVRRRIAIPGARVNVDISGAMGPGGSPIEVLVKGPDLATLTELTRHIEDEVAAVPGTREVRSSVTRGLPELQVVVDRRRAAQNGLTAAQVAGAVRAAVEGQVAGRFRSGGEEYDIRVRAGEAVRADPGALAQLYIAGATGRFVPLAEVARLEQASGPVRIDRDGQARVARITGQLHDRDLGSVVTDIRGRLDRLALPPGYQIEYGGQNKEMEEAFLGLTQALGLSVILIYLVMAAQFESFLYPFVIIFAVPFAFVGAVLGLFLTGRSLDIAAFMGVIMLVGIVVNNAIVLVDYINRLRTRGLDCTAAIVRAGPTRLRPVLMTTLTTVLGLLPLAMGLGEGSEQEAPLATVVIGGLTLSTLLTLVVIPVMYSLMDSLRHRLGLAPVSKPAAAGD